MFCRYCGKPIADDSIFCQYCGSNISVDGLSNNLKPKKILRIKASYYSKIWSCFKWSDIVSSINKIAIFIWKVIHSIFVIIVMIMAYTTIGFIMAPLIAMFNAQIPSLGMSSMLVNIWKKKKSIDITKEE